MTERSGPTVFHYYARYLVHPSGVTDSIDNWVGALASSGERVGILAAEPRSGRANEFADMERTTVIAHAGWSRASWIPVGLFRTLRRGDLLVLHEGWVLSNIFAAAIARVKRVPYVIVPHGVYERGIIKRTRDVADLRRLAERWMLRHAAAVHVFYPSESTVVSDVEPRVDDFIVHPNGAPVSDTEWTGDGDYFLWIGRFDPHHKGLDNLVKSWSLLPVPRPKLMLAGPDFMGGRKQIEDLIRDEDLGDVITVTGRVSGEEKKALMRGARAYLHPSRWESCSIMLLEMLGLGVPTIVSNTIHAARELEPAGVVAVADFRENRESITEALGRADRNHELGGKARAWVDSEGSWAAVGPSYAHDIRNIQRSFA